MLTQLQLEGPELEPLLARVRSELGPHARIVHAEKIRSGGVAGFFAHERFELTVEVDTSLPRTAPAPPVAPPVAEPAPPVAQAAAAPAPAPAPVPAPAAPVAETAVAVRAPEPAPSFSAIAGLSEQEPSLFTSLAGLTAPVGPPADAPVPARTAAAAMHAYAPQAAPSAVPSQREELPSVLAALLDGRPAAAPPPPPRAPQVDAAPATDGPATFAPYAAFAGVLDATPAASSQPAPAPAPAATVPSSVLDLAERISAGEADAVVSTQSPSFAALLSRLGDDIGALGDEHPEEVVPAAAPVIDAEPAAPAGTSAPDAGVVAVRPPTEIVLPEAPGATVDLRDVAQEGPAAELARLGLPSHLRPTGVGEQLHTALRASLSRLPTAPPALNRPGGVLAVVGPLAQALHVAREIAAELGLPAATSVAVATAGTGVHDVAERQVLHDAAEAAERRAAWRRRSNLTVVAVDAPLTASGAAEARAFLNALSPTSTWGVVEATRKAQDVGSWTRALGGVHAIALTELEEPSDPAAVLELGIPVSRLGGRPATPRAWATLLTGRLAA